MNVDLEFSFLFINGIFTFLIGLIILYLMQNGRFQKHRFYYTWAIGFALYGIQILTRAFNLSIIISSVLMIATLIFFIGGSWLLTRQKTVFLMISLTGVLIVILFSLFVFEIVTYDVGRIIGLTLFFITIIFSIIDQRVVFGRNVDKLIIGWSLLIFANTLLYFSGFLTDSLAIMSKIIILLGIIDYDFVIIAERVQRGMIGSRLKFINGNKPEGGLTLIIPPEKNGGSWKAKTVDWIIKKAQKNLDMKHLNYLFAFKDVFSHQDLRRIKWISPDQIQVFLFSENINVSDEEFSVISPELTKIGVTINEIAKKHLGLNDGADLFITNISSMIHLFGEYPVYRLLLDKLGILRRSGVTLYAVFLPQTHDERVFSLFRSVSDKMISL